jgi:deoxyribonuclease-4
MITQFSYFELVRSRIIPDLSPFTPHIATKKYPPWIYALKKVYPDTFMDFGLFIENIIAKTIQNQPINYPEIWMACSDIPVPNEIQGQNNFLGGIIGWTKSIFNGFQIEHNPEFTFQNIQGHPDLISKNQNGTLIIEVKTTSGFKSMAEQTYLQILAYCTLARSCGQVCNFISILLPLQRQIMWFNMTGWNEKNYLDLLMREAEWVDKDMEIFNPLSFVSEKEENIPLILSVNIVGFVGRYLDSDILGSHAPKEYVFGEKFRNSTKPIQIFIANPQGKDLVSQQDILDIKQNMSPQSRLFIHSPYLINLCSDESSGIERLCHELVAGQQIGALGVVVHVGKYKDLTIEQGLYKMEMSVRHALKFATAECPLIIETPAGQGTELCTNLEEFQAFYSLFCGVPNLKICVDFAHVFALGYDPKYYLNSWIVKYPGAIVLVHFNDSRKPRGSRVDAHYPAGLGYIGYTRLWKVHELCRKHNIPMVRE